MQEFVAFPPKLYLETSAELERLRAREVDLKREGRWHDVDYLSYTLEVLREIDKLVYSSFDFETTVEVEELARATIADHWLVIACRSEDGIYEVEQLLRRLHGERLGVIVLQKGDSNYTLRRANHFLPVNLKAIYDRLNVRDPAVTRSRARNRWGGSEEIGGSPRATGTELTAEQIVEICSTAYQKPARLQAVTTILEALGATTAIPIAAVSVIALNGYMRRPFPSLADVFVGRPTAFAAILACLSLLLLLPRWRRSGDYGVRAHEGLDWLYLFLGAAALSLAGGAWFTGALSPDRMILTLPAFDRAFPPLLLAIASELLFRGTVHGVLARAYETQKIGRHWYLSWPVVISSVAYAFWALVPFHAPTALVGMRTGAAALLFGICCGMARERSGSLLAPILMHCSCLFIPVL
jgi:membrane protease YdiL (CAAX protease family)